ncbi:MAG: hypothetical protein EXR52_03030 [Dehalococcoidia bacterium]|nr:hypothetical protein [Dehalococcoidia bacterium]
MQLSFDRMQKRLVAMAATLTIRAGALAAGTPLAIAAITQAPVLGAPSGGEQLTSFGPTLQWTCHPAAHSISYR